MGVAYSSYYSLDTEKEKQQVFRERAHKFRVAKKAQGASIGRKIIYIDASGVDWNNPTVTVKQAVDAGFNVILFAFYLSDRGAFDFALLWASLSQDVQRATVEYAHQRNALLMVAAAGSMIGHTISILKLTPQKCQDLR